MKLGTLTNSRLWMPVLAIALVVGLVSWDHRQIPPGNNQDQHPTDTLPKKKKVKTEKKVRDLDEVIEELEAVDMDHEMEKVQEEISKALKQIDGEKIRLQVEQSLKEVDMNKIRQEIDKAMKEVDLEKVKMEVENSIARIDWDKIRKELDEVKKMDFSKFEEEMKQVQEELKNLKPRLEKELANVKVDMEKAKVEIEKAKAEMKEYKGFVDGLEKDGLINKKDNYSIRHEDGVLTVNGKKVSEQVYNKYKSFLEKHKKFNIERTSDDFDIDMD
jgi:copper chaperone CopZ